MDHHTKLIRGAAVVTVDPALGVLETGDVLVEGDTIAAVAPALDAPPAAQVVDGRGHILIPGLINAHLHAWQTTVRGMGMNWSGVEHHLRMQSQFVPALTPEDLGHAEFVGAANLLDGGVTSVLEWCHGNRTPEHSDAALDGLRRAGVRGVFAHGTVKTLPRDGEPHFSQVPHPRAEAKRLRAVLDGDPLLTLALGVLGPDYAPIEVCRQDFGLARELDVLTTAHVSGHPGKVPDGYRRIVAEGLLTGPHNVVHATAMADDELRLLLDHGASITATSSVEVNGGFREPVIGRVLALGGRPSIGTDSETATAADMFAAMRDSLTIQRLFDHHAAQRAAGVRPGRAATNQVARGMPVPPRKTPSSYDALRWATLDNARALGIDALVGSITPGKRADLVLLRGTDLNLTPALNPVDAAVGFAHPGNVDTVLVAGRTVKSGGVLRARAAAQAAGAALRERAERLLATLGLADLRDSTGTRPVPPGPGHPAGS
ncbi:amidohydrolase family protein [Streptomyces sp. DSM 44915]|uniref:Amidohydrolase family protein n=1 Tax=Streptomyces chisholmiae TaxID=3075540 RepID=A0ABU2JMQ2_9ACTN|nr:amidohydrolase family protein [Streptomyces sp. DSM 44915]MDT0265993.1 amidohydrolase family protein [Streptomyces sp. DSM 44915]